MIKFLNNPLVSVVMCVYNEEENHLISAIESILNQSFIDFEFIIILDNYNNIKLKKVIEYYKSLDSRIIFIINKENIGLAKSLNVGIKNSRGKYIARMDSDDISFNERLASQVNFMEKNSKVALCGTKVVYIDEFNNLISEQKKIPIEFKKIKKYLKYNNCIAHPSFMFRRSIINKLGGYKNIPYAEDYELLQRLIINGYEVVNIDSVLLKYRIRKNGISESNKLLQIIVSEYLRYIYIRNLRGVDIRYSEEELSKYIKKFNNKKNKAIIKLDNLISKSKFKFLVNFLFVFVSGLISKLFFNILKNKTICKFILVDI